METTNFLVPVHRKISSDEVQALLKKYSIEDISKLPKIKKSDSALESLGVEIGDVVEIIRSSFAGDNNVYYRVVVE